MASTTMGMILAAVGLAAVGGEPRHQATPPPAKTAAVLAIVPPTPGRTIVKEPVYQTKTPKYGLLVFGPEAKDKVWIVLDGDTLYVDRNGNGDLTDPGEMVAAKKKKPLAGNTEEYTFEVGELTLGGRTHKGLTLTATPLTAHSSPSIQHLPEVKSALAKDPKTMVFILSVDVDVPGMKGGGLGGRSTYIAGFMDINGVLLFGDKPANAPVIHFGGPLEITFYELPTNVRAGRDSVLVLVVGTSGIGSGTFAMLAYNTTIPKDAKPVIEATYESNIPGDSPIKEKHILNERCCQVNLYDTIKIPQTASPATGSFRLSLDGWKEGKVASTSHQIKVLPKLGTKAEPASVNLICTLSNPQTQAERNSNVCGLKFSQDSKRLFSSSYPSGVVQTWAIDEKRELLRIETPPGKRASADFAFFSSDEKTVYVPYEVRKLVPVEKDGSKTVRIEYSGSIRIWDLNTGEEKAPLNPPADHSPSIAASQSPDGRFLACVERVSHETGEKQITLAVVWDLKTGKRKELADGYWVPTFAPNGKTLAVYSLDYAAKTSIIRLFDVGTFKELAKLECPEKDRYFSVGGFSPDGSTIALSLGGKKGAPCEIWFRDGKTLEDRGRFTSEGDPEQSGWGVGRFTPDGTRYIILNVKDKGVVWDVAGKKVVRTFDAGTTGNIAMSIAMSPDGKLLAVAWAPKADPGLKESGSTDPRDLPQPRVTLYELTSNASPRTMIAPHGFLGSLAFSPDGKTLAFGTTGGIRLFDLTK